MPNLFADIPAALPQELTEVLVSADSLRVEKIVSTGHHSEAGFWYQQPENEWVVVLAGQAVLEFDDGQPPLKMQVGDHILLPAGKRHRVASTSSSQPTVWLAVFWT